MCIVKCCGPIRIGFPRVHVVGYVHYTGIYELNLRKEGAAMSRKLYAALILLSLIWGGSFFFIKILLEDFGPWSIAFLRSSFGFIVITLIMLVMKERFELGKIRWLPLIAVAIMNTAFPWALIAFSETKVTSGMASVLNATTPIWSMIMGIVFFRVASKRQQWLGMAIATVGLIVLLDINPISIISVDLVGFVAMMAATCMYGAAAQMSRRYLSSMSMYQITFGTLFTGMVTAGIIAMFTESVSFAPLMSLDTLGALIGLGAFGSGFAYILFYYMIQKGSPEFATMVTYLVPATAIIWGATLLGEELHWSLFAGLVLILGGVFLANRKERPKPEADSVKERAVYGK